MTFEKNIGQTSKLELNDNNLATQKKDEEIPTEINEAKKYSTKTELSNLIPKKNSGEIFTNKTLMAKGISKEFENFIDLENKQTNSKLNEANQKFIKDK